MASHNLPTELTSFVGRRDELVDVERLVSTRRLVTLTGVGGCGKTRLAVALCARLVDDRPDGVWLVDLGSAADPAHLPRLAAATLGVLIEPGGDQVQGLVSQLRQRRLLLCLDTCEHVLDAAAALAEALLRHCPHVSIVATSREPLGVEGETVWRVPSLKRDEALELFAERASLAAPDFDVHAAQDDVRAVCARVDNIPLAIELAAAWVRVLSAGQIASGLDDRFRLLAGGPRRAVPRHQTLLASMAWSNALLADDEKVVFRRLAVFAGAFSLAAVEAVCGDGGVLRDGAAAMLRRLVDKSLVTGRESKHEVRYRLLDTVRQYAQEQLRAAGEVEFVRDRHLDYHLTLVEGAQPGLDSDQDASRRELASHHDDISAALEWGLSAPSDRADHGRRLAAAMARQWFVRGQSAEGLEFLRRAVDADPADRSGLQGRLLAGIAALGMVSGRLDLIAETTVPGLEISAEVGDDVTRARCLAASAWPAFFRDFEECRRLTIEAEEVAAAAGDHFARDWAAVLGAYTLTTRDRHDEAVAQARPAFERSSPRGDRFCAAFARGVELWAKFETGDVRAAVTIGEEIMDIASPLGDYFTVGTMAGNLALAMGRAGDIATARKIMEPILRSVDGREVDVVAYMHSIGMLTLWDGDLDEAVGWFARGVQRMAGGTRDWTATRCLPGLASALRRLGRLDEAAGYAVEGVALATEFGSPYILADALDERARLARDTDISSAYDLHHEALALRREHRLRSYYVDSLDALARLELLTEDYADAVQLLAASDAAREVIGYPRPPVDLTEHESVVASLRAGLGDGEYEALWRDGTARSLDDAVAAVTRGRGPRNRPRSGWASLTRTELDVIRLLTEGMSNPEIAGRLYMSRATVKTHLSHVYAKLGIANRTELATVAATHLHDHRNGR